MTIFISIRILSSSVDLWNENKRYDIKVETHWGATLLCEGEMPWWLHCDRTHWRKKATGRLAHKTQWTCLMWNTVPWNWNHLWGAVKWLVQCPFYDSVLEEAINLKHCALGTCSVRVMCMYLLCRLHYVLLCCYRFYTLLLFSTRVCAFH